jgi:hypothetical protein
LPKLDEFRQMLKEIAQTGMHSNILRVLYDVRSGARLPDTMRAQDYGVAMAELLPHWFRVAMLGYEIDIHRRHLETVAVNRGLYVKYFTDHDQALAWLFGGGG